MAWTDERVDVLKKLWVEGKSASFIAKKLGGVTRNAVIGKVHRLGLSNRTSTSLDKSKAKEKLPKKEKQAIKQEKNSVEKKVDLAKTLTKPIPRPKLIITAGQPLPPQPSANEISPEALATVKEVEKTAKKLTVMELTERTCKWPVGDPATEDFWFCGLPAQAGKPYCEAHVGVAFQPMSTRRERRR